MEQGKKKAATDVINAFLNQMSALVRSGGLSAADAQPLRDQATCVVGQLGS